MSLFSNITGFNASTIKEYANQKDVKDDDKNVDYSTVDYCIGDNNNSSYNNAFEKEDNTYTGYSSEYEIASKYLSDNETHSTFEA